MKYVYLVYEDCHGLIAICGTPERATQMVKDEAFSGGLPEDTSLDYDDEDSWGWEGATWWKREGVIQ